jgi:hypothetical protein
LIHIKCGVVTIGLRELGPPVLGTRVAPIAHVQLTSRTPRMVIHGIS